ncbi:heat shock factor 2-binding protein [Cardiocondyla obscurior]|uniref:heat shock factor 2-binding protein n=1 Tax=Cardiocondyla obscurior TaxID=286306 RepID=UPI0039656F12
MFSQVQDKIGELLSIVNGTFGAFVSTYKSAFPPTSNVEYQFVMGLLGIVTNISARPEGREFLITIPSGTELVQKLIKLTPELPSVPRTVYLKSFIEIAKFRRHFKTSNYRLILMILYNVSINETGFRYLLESRVADALSHCLDDEASSAEMQLLCLRILQSVTYDLEPEYVRDLIGIIPIERIETMMSASQSDISKAAELVVQHLRQRQNILKSDH